MRPRHQGNKNNHIRVQLRLLFVMRFIKPTFSLNIPGIRRVMYLGFVSTSQTEYSTWHCTSIPCCIPHVQDSTATEHCEASKRDSKTAHLARVHVHVEHIQQRPRGAEISVKCVFRNHLNQMSQKGRSEFKEKI